MFFSKSLLVKLALTAFIPSITFCLEIKAEINDAHYKIIEVFFQQHRNVSYSLNLWRIKLF